MYQNILTEVDHGVGMLTLNRPESHNACDDALIAELTDAIEMLENDADARLLVISGTGRSFCAGTNLRWMKRVTDFSAEDSLNDARALAEMLHNLAQTRKPSIARVHGPAYGIGVGLVAACDIAIATYDARFSLPEIKRGCIPAEIAPHLVAAIGERHARRYMLTGERFAAAEAYRIGLVHEIVPDEAALDEAIGEIVAALLKNSPNALAECKELIHAVVSRPISADLIEDTAQRSCRTRASDEGHEGIDAFLEKRKPLWLRQTD